MPESEDTEVSGYRLRQHLNADCVIDSTANPEINSIRESVYHQPQQKDVSVIATEQQHWDFSYSSLHMMQLPRLTQTTNSNVSSI